jgi:hypothetical protein
MRDTRIPSDRPQQRRTLGFARDRVQARGAGATEGETDAVRHCQQPYVPKWASETGPGLGRPTWSKQRLWHTIPDGDRRVRPEWRAFEEGPHGPRNCLRHRDCVAVVAVFSEPVSSARLHHSLFCSEKTGKMAKSGPLCSAKPDWEAQNSTLSGRHSLHIGTGNFSAPCKECFVAFKDSGRREVRGGRLVSAVTLT